MIRSASLTFSNHPGSPTNSGKLFCLEPKCLEKQKNYSLFSESSFIKKVLENVPKENKVFFENVKELKIFPVFVSSNFFETKNDKAFINGDEDQLNRVFINLIKNSEEAFEDIIKKDPNFKGNIDIEINNNNDYIVCRLTDNGPGIRDAKKAMTPYFTTKKKELV